jgi:hypothetical protein
MENMDYELLRFEISKIGSNSVINTETDFFKSSGYIANSLKFCSDSLTRKLLFLVKCQVYLKFKYLDI